MEISQLQILEFKLFENRYLWLNDTSVFLFEKGTFVRLRILVIMRQWKIVSLIQEKEVLKFKKQKCDRLH